MAVLFDSSVKASLEEYSDSLLLYPISEERVLEKVIKMRQALEKVALSPTSYPICRYKNLGQVFDSGGNPQNLNLRQFNYSDKSKFKWCFSFLYDELSNTVTFIKMLASIYVKEETSKTINRIISESINKFLRGIVNEDRDARIRRIVRESIDRYINKMIA